MTKEVKIEAERLYHLGVSLQIIGKRLGFSATGIEHQMRGKARLLEFIECRRCYKVKPQGEFYKSPPGRICLSCARFRYRMVSIKRLYGIEADEYHKFLDLHGYKCGICGIKGQVGRGGKELCIDHDHHTKRLRGVLCNGCNRFLGLAGENIAVLESAISYLRRNVS